MRQERNGWILLVLELWYTCSTGVPTMQDAVWKSIQQYAEVLVIPRLARLFCVAARSVQIIGSCEREWDNIAKLCLAIYKEYRSFVDDVLGKGRRCTCYKSVVVHWVLHPLPGVSYIALCSKRYLGTWGGLFFCCWQYPHGCAWESRHAS